MGSLGLTREAYEEADSTRGCLDIKRLATVNQSLSELLSARILAKWSLLSVGHQHKPS